MSKEKPIDYYFVHIYAFLLLNLNALANIELS